MTIESKCLYYLFILSALAISFHSYSQTCIIGYKNADSVTIGIDSRATFYSFSKTATNRDTTIYTYFTQCKIGNIKNIYFAIGGMYLDETREQIKNIYKEGMKLDSLVSRFLEKRKIDLTNAIEEKRKLNFDFYLKYFNKIEVSGVIFFALEDSTPKMIYNSFRTTNDSNEACSINTIDYSNYSIPWYVAIGHHKEIDSLLPSIKYDNLGIANGIKSLIKIEIENAPLVVSEPINLISVSKSGVRWIEGESCRK